MFRDREIESLRLRKELLVCECDARRVQLVAEWQHLRSPQAWLDEAAQAVSGHPLWTAGLAMAAGTLLVQALRRPGAVAGRVARLGRFMPVLLSVWKYLVAKRREA